MSAMNWAAGEGHLEVVEWLHHNRRVNWLKLDPVRATPSLSLHGIVKNEKGSVLFLSVDGWRTRFLIPKASFLGLGQKLAECQWLAGRVNIRDS